MQALVTTTFTVVLLTTSSCQTAYYNQNQTTARSKYVGNHTASYLMVECAYYENFYACTLVCIELSELVCYEINVVTVGVHKCGVASPSHHHPGQSVHRLNSPSKESQWSQQWACRDIVMV